MEHSLRDAVLARAKESKPVYEPCMFGDFGTVYVKRLNVGERDAYEKATPGNTVGRAVTVIHGCFDEHGVRIFEEQDVPAIADLEPAVVDPVVKCFLKLNGFTKEDQAELLKNSNGQAGSS